MVKKAKKTVKKKAKKKRSIKQPLSRLNCLSKKAEIPDLTGLHHSELLIVAVGNLYIFRDIIEGLNPSKEDVYDMQVAENKIRQSMMQLIALFEESNHVSSKPKRRGRINKKS